MASLAAAVNVAMPGSYVEVEIPTNEPRSRAGAVAEFNVNEQ